MAVHPLAVAVNFASLAVVVKLRMQRKESDAFLVQVGKVRTYKCHNFGIGVVRTRLPIVFFLLPGAIGSSRL